jgi:nicotinamide riboside transporter PnuC
MADYQWREKMRKVESSTKEVSQVPERAKTLGFGCFTVGMFVVVLLFAFISFGLISQSYWIAGGFSLVFTLGLAFISIQLLRADKLP